MISSNTNDKLFHLLGSSSSPRLSTQFFLQQHGHTQWNKRKHPLSETLNFGVDEADNRKVKSFFSIELLEEGILWTFLRKTLSLPIFMLVYYHKWSDLISKRHCKTISSFWLSNAIRAAPWRLCHQRIVFFCTTPLQKKIQLALVFFKIR